MKIHEHVFFFWLLKVDFESLFSFTSDKIEQLWMENWNMVVYYVTEMEQKRGLLVGLQYETKFPGWVWNLKLWRARSRLYRRRFLQIKTHLKALADIYTIHTFAQISDLKISITSKSLKSSKILQIVFWIFDWKLAESVCLPKNAFVQFVLLCTDADVDDQIRVGIRI